MARRKNEGAKMRRRFLIGAAALVIGVGLPAAALRVKLDRPDVAFRKDYPAAARQKVQSVLQRKDCTFVRGEGINSFTTLEYRGATQALNHFVEELAACPSVTVSVSLKKLPEDIDWRVSHDGHTNRFHTQVNLRSPRLDLETLVLPELKGPMSPR